MTAFLKQLNNYWRARNRREQVLAILVGIILLGMGLYWLLMGAMDDLRRLDREIARLQDDIVIFHGQIARKQSVESHYSAVAAQHSSAWTEPEIQERLRQEIYRLAKNVPPPLNEEGIPTTTSSEGGNLVEIPALGQGALSEGEEDYRQYSISFRVPPVEYPAIFAFLERLQESPQSLRIDGLELIRSPESTQVMANIDLARIIVAGAAGASDTGQEVLVSAGAPLELVPSEWECEGCSVGLTAEYVTTGEDALEATASGEDALLYTTRSLPAGATYDLTVDITAFGPAQLELAQEGLSESFAGSGQALEEDGLPYRYTARFTVPGEGGRTTVRLPVIRFNGAGNRIVVDNLTLTQLTRS